MFERKKMPRIAIEVEQDLKNKFVKKADDDGYTVKRLLVKWIKKYLGGSLKS